MQEAPRIDFSNAFLLFIIQIFDQLSQPFRRHLVDKLLDTLSFSFRFIRHLTLTIFGPNVPFLGLVHHLDIAYTVVLVRHLLINPKPMYFCHA